MTTLKLGSQVMNATNDIYTVVCVEDGYSYGLFDPSDANIMTDPKWTTLKNLWEDIKEDVTIYEPIQVNQTKQEQFDSLYNADSNKNLDEVCLTNSTISHLELLDASINKMVKLGLTESDILKIINEHMQDLDLL